MPRWLARQQARPENLDRKTWSWPCKRIRLLILDILKKPVSSHAALQILRTNLEKKRQRLTIMRPLPCGKPCSAIDRRRPSRPRLQENMPGVETWIMG